MKHQAVIVSDLHLGTRDSKADEFLEFIENNPTELLILNGDIVDGWAIHRGSRWKPKHTKVINKILKLSKHTEIIWIRGNHDEFIKEFIGISFANIQLCENYVLELNNGEKYYTFHGDVIDVFITKYKFLSKIGSIGYDFLLWLNHWYTSYRKLLKLPYKSISKTVKNNVKAATNHINGFEITAIQLAIKENCDGVICGHIHQPSDKIINGKRYLNSGDWVESLSAIIIDTKNNIILTKL